MTTATFSRSGTGAWIMRSGWDECIPPICKSVGGRWSPSARAWRFASLLQAQQAAAELRRVGFTVLDEFPVTSALANPRDLVAAFELLFGKLPIEARKPVYRALVGVLHPDRGGDTATMQALTAGYDKVGAAA